MIRIYCDAAVKGVNGPAGLGLVILKDGQQIQLSESLSQVYDNHQAEFLAIQAALHWLENQEHHDQFIFIYSDSKTAVSAINKNYSKHEIYKPIMKSIVKQLKQFQQIHLEWVAEKNNRGADKLARQGLQKAIKNQM